MLSLSRTCFIVIFFSFVYCQKYYVGTVTLDYDNPARPKCYNSSCEEHEIFMNTSLCSYFNDSRSVQTFFDPSESFGISPPDWMLTEVKLFVFGRFNCSLSPNEELTVLFILQNNSINNIFTPIPSMSPGCSCPNCVTMVEFSAKEPGGFPGYAYNSYNNLTIYPANTRRRMFCISRIDIQLIFTSVPNIYDQYPTSGPLSGGTLVHFSTKGVNDVANVSCRFAQSDPVEGIPIGGSFSTFSCLSPLVVSPTYSTIYVEFMMASDYIWSLQRFFQYYADPELSSLTPTEGSPGTEVTISGKNFDPHEVRCKFGNNTVAGRIVNSTVICRAPPGSGNVSVDITFNTQQFTSSNLTFLYLDGDEFWEKNFWIIIVASCVALIAILLGVVFFFYRKQKTASPYVANLSLNNDSIDHSPLLSGSRSWDSVIPQQDLGKIQILEKIGRGTHGEVFKAIWQGTVVAIKKLPAHLLTDEFLDDFVMEAQIMKSLRHPNVLQFLAASTVPPDICIIMEFMSRGSLFQVIHNKTIDLNWSLIRKILLDAARGMNYLHNSTPKILHRDLKSHNLLLDENWKCKVCDFGLSRMLSESPSLATMTACGTPCWAAPEILRHQRYSEKADVYSFAVVMWECVTRQVPYQGMPPFQIVFAVGTEGLRPPIPFNLDPAITKLITDGWAEVADSRPSFEELLVVLENLELNSLHI